MKIESRLSGAKVCLYKRTETADERRGCFAALLTGQVMLCAGLPSRTELFHA